MRWKYVPAGAGFAKPKVSEHLDDLWGQVTSIRPELVIRYPYEPPPCLLGSSSGGASLPDLCYSGMTW